MKKRNRAPARLRWLRAWLVQIIIMLAVCLVTSACFGVLPKALYGVLIWGVVPLSGALTACHAVRRGLLNYAAWIAPPVCMYAAHYLLWRFAPSAGAALLCAFISLVGSAAGEVLRQRDRQNHR